MTAANGAPVLLLLFNRPRLTVRAMAAIRSARPARLYLAADGPRAGRSEDRDACAAAREAALAAVDWPCSVKTLYRDDNLGCARAVHGAVSWFFEHEAEGIVLEDDCIAAPAFFPFCTEMLQRYRSEPRVFAVSGDNFVESATAASPSYWFNGVFHCWGWAAWRDRWAKVPRTIDQPDQDAIHRTLLRAGLSRAEVAYWSPLFDRVRTRVDSTRRLDSWAYAALYHVFVNRYLCICPARNLVSNVGFGSGSTHFQDVGADAGMQVALGELPFPLTHPEKVALDRRLHVRNLRAHFGIRTGRVADLVAGAMAWFGAGIGISFRRKADR
jgi:hypothetical protein